MTVKFLSISVNDCRMSCLRPKFIYLSTEDKNAYPFSNFPIPSREHPA